MRTIIETTTLVTDMILKVIMNFEISLRRVGCGESCPTVVHLHNFFCRNKAQNDSAHLPSLAVVATTALRVSEE
jgi:hypothetical protein